MDLDLIQKLVNERKMKWSTHVAARMHERNIKRMDVLNCLLHGEIIEEYPDDFPTPSCLVFGTTLRNEVIHVVAGCDDSTVYIITVYRPDSDSFESDLKTRKER